MQSWGGARSSGQLSHSEPSAASVTGGGQWLCFYDLRKKFSTLEEAERFRRRTAVHIPEYPEFGEYTYWYQPALRHLAQKEYPETPILEIAEGQARRTSTRVQNEVSKVLSVRPSDEELERKKAAKRKGKAAPKSDAKTHT